jgi:hypothetical protein
MKFYLMAGGLLITAASVYGVTDYIKTKNKKAFKEMYSETPVALKENVKLHDVKEEDFSRGKIDPPPPPKQEPVKAVAAKQKTSKKKKQIEVIPMPEINTVRAPAVEEIKTPLPEVKVTTAPKEVKRPRKKINSKMFSRGAIERRIEEPKAIDTTAAKKN